MSGILGLVFASLTAVFKSSSSIISKELLDTEISYIASSWAIRFFGIPILIVATVVTGGIPSIESEFFLYLTLTSVFGVVATLSYMKALSVSDISVIDPISSLSPLLLLITTPLIVNQVPSPAGLVGVMIVVSGVYLLKIDSGNSSSSGGPLSPVRSVVTDPGFKYIFIMLIIYSITAPIDKLAVDAAGSVFYSLSLHIGQSLVLTPLFIYTSDDWQAEMFSMDTLKLSSIGVLSGISSMLQMIALTYTLVVYVISIKRLGILISTAWGVIVRDEASGIYRIIGAGLIILGTILISISV